MAQSEDALEQALKHLDAEQKGNLGDMMAAYKSGGKAALAEALRAIEKPRPEPKTNDPAK